MPRFTVIAGPQLGQTFELAVHRTVIGRELAKVNIHLSPTEVSREHAAVICQDGQVFLEDLGALNKTYLNGQIVAPRQPVQLRDNDKVKLGPVVLQFQIDRPSRPVVPVVPEPVNVTATISAEPSNLGLYSSNPAQKLRGVLDIARVLGTTLELDPLLDSLLGHLFNLFPQADRGMVLLLEREGGVRRLEDSASQLLFRVRAQRVRKSSAMQDYAYSRSLVNRALENGEGLLSENVLHDENLPTTRTMTAMELRSFLCVPLLGTAGRRLGVLQLDAMRGGMGGAFTREDLDLLAAISLQVSIVVEKSAMHAELIRRAKTDQELEAAGEIQLSMLPQNFEALEKGLDIEVFAKVLPARGVAGDLYDLFPLPDGRLAFLLGDVCGKGMPAALYMIAVRTLTRQFISQSSSPADLIVQLHHALRASFPSEQYVTMVHGVYDPASHRLTFAQAAHPAPILRKADGSITQVKSEPSYWVGHLLSAPEPADTTIEMAPGDTFICFTDGFTEAFNRERDQFDEQQLMALLAGARTNLPLRQCFDEVAASLRRFVAGLDQQDDQTLLLLRRNA